MLNVAAVVVLYHPAENVYSNILSYLHAVPLLIVVDNSPVNSIPDHLKNNAKVTTLHDGDNKGIAERLNQAAEIAMNKGFEWLLTMDQDSFFAPGMIEKYFMQIANYPEKRQVAMFGVEFEKEDIAAEAAIAVNYLITSGSVVNLPLLPVIGCFDEDLFIDEVDLEYCFRAITKGYKIIKFPFIFLAHNLGEKGHYRSLKNFKTSQRALHSSLRLYYMVRNFLYVQKKYQRQFTEEHAERKKTLLNRIKNNLLYGSSRLQTLQLVSKAYRDFKSDRMGKIK